MVSDGWGLTMLTCEGSAMAASRAAARPAAPFRPFVALPLALGVPVPALGPVGAREIRAERDELSCRSCVQSLLMLPREGTEARRLEARGRAIGFLMPTREARLPPLEEEDLAGRDWRREEKILEARASLRLRSRPGELVRASTIEETKNERSEKKKKSERSHGAAVERSQE